MQTQARRADEQAAVERVVGVRGGTVLPSATDPPDCYMRDDSGAVLHPVEVTRADDAPYGQMPDPRNGASAARAEAHANAMVRRLLAAGATAVMSGVHDARRPYARAIPPGMRLPLPAGPVDQVPAIVAAIQAKCAKGYATGTILVVDYQNGWPLSDMQLQVVGKQVAHARRGFREVWIVPEFSRGAQQVPLLR